MAPALSRVHGNASRGRHVQQQTGAASPPKPTNSTSRSPMERYKSVLCGVGIAEIIIGTLCFVFGKAIQFIAPAKAEYIEHTEHSSTYAKIFRDDMTYAFLANAFGIFSIIVGILSVVERNSPWRFIFYVKMALSIIGVIMMGAFTTLSAIATARSMFLQDQPVFKAFNAVLTVLGLVGTLIIIIDFGYCCAGVCYKSKQTILQAQVFANPLALSATEPETEAPFPRQAEHQQTAQAEMGEKANANLRECNNLLTVE